MEERGKVKPEPRQPHGGGKMRRRRRGRRERRTWSHHQRCSGRSGKEKEGN